VPWYYPGRDTWLKETDLYLTDRRNGDPVKRRGEAENREQKEKTRDVALGYETCRREGSSPDVEKGEKE
jgi:hypothetical protein